MTNTATVIGLGPMGQAIAQTLLAAGYEVTVWNRTQEKAVRLEPLGARIAPTPEDSVRNSEIVLISVRGNDVAQSILNQVDFSNVDPIIVNLSSDTPASARELSAWAASHGVRYLGGAMLTPSVLVGQPGSTAVLGGEQGTYQEAWLTLEKIAPKLDHYGADAGTVAALDLALLDAFWTTVAGWSHAVALGRAEGLSPAALTERLTAMVHLAAQVGAEISHDVEAGDYSGDVSTIASAHATLTHILQASEDKALDVGLPRAISKLLQRAIDGGRQIDGPSRLVAMIEERG